MFRSFLNAKFSAPELDTFKTIAGDAPEILFKEKNSKFFASAFALSDENQVKQHIDALRKKHQGAGHFCYAWQIGAENPAFRANDDGEPSNTAGMPIFGQIQSFGITNVLVVVVRYFGGVKLGVGGLISAYRTAAQLALSNAEIVERTIDKKFIISFSYEDLNKVMRIIRETGARIVAQQMESDCKITVTIRKNDTEKFLRAFEPAFKVLVSEA